MEHLLVLVFLQQVEGRVLVSGERLLRIDRRIEHLGIAYGVAGSLLLVWQPRRYPCRYAAEAAAAAFISWRFLLCALLLGAHAAAPGMNETLVAAAF